jgi:hypothetical protein
MFYWYPILTNHGLPVPFDSNGWTMILDAIGMYQFFDGVIMLMNKITQTLIGADLSRLVDLSAFIG